MRFGYSRFMRKASELCTDNIMENPLIMDQMSQKWFSSWRTNLEKTIYYTDLVKIRANHRRIFSKFIVFTISKIWKCLWRRPFSPDFPKLSPNFLEKISQNIFCIFFDKDWWNWLFRWIMASNRASQSCYSDSIMLKWQKIILEWFSSVSWLIRSQCILSPPWRQKTGKISDVFRM